MYFKKLMSAVLSGVFLISTMGTAAAEVPQTVDNGGKRYIRW